MHIKNISELPLISGEKNRIRKKVNCTTICFSEIESQFSSSVYLDAHIAILVLSGVGKICVNYRTCPIQGGSLVLLSSAHLFHFLEYDSGIRCLCLFVSKEFTDEMDSTDMIHKRMKYGVRLYNAPVLQASAANTIRLERRMQEVDRAIDDTGHFYHKEMILNALFAFYLDLSDVIERYTADVGEESPTRYESIIKSFIELLAANYREEHGVEFYASRLNLSPHYLTEIVKRVTGQSVSDFIFEMLFSEARNLLIHSPLSIQEIATVLNFSDQSSFGKFFKRKSGLSPKQFR